MSAAEVDAYLARLPAAQKAVLQELREKLAQLLPDAEQGVSYGMPTFKVGGKGIAGFAAHTGHCSYSPMSGTVTSTLADVLAGFRTTKGSVRFTPEHPLPSAVVAALVAARQAEIAG